MNHRSVAFSALFAVVVILTIAAVAVAGPAAKGKPNKQQVDATETSLNTQYQNSCIYEKAVSPRQWIGLVSEMDYTKFEKTGSQDDVVLKVTRLWVNAKGAFKDKANETVPVNFKDVQDNYNFVTTISLDEAMAQVGRKCKPRPAAAPAAGAKAAPPAGSAPAAKGK